MGFTAEAIQDMERRFPQWTEWERTCTEWEKNARQLAQALRFYNDGEYW